MRADSMNSVGLITESNLVFILSTFQSMDYIAHHTEQFIAKPLKNLPTKQFNYSYTREN